MKHSFAKHSFAKHGGGQTSQKNAVISARQAKYGDVVYLRPDGEVVFVRLETLTVAELPDTWIAVGYVEEPMNTDGKVLICEKSSASQKVAAVFRFRVNNMILDGEEHSGSVKLNRVSYADWSYSATSKAEFAEALNTYLAEQTSGAFWSYYDEYDDNVYLILGNYTAYENSESAYAIAGCTVTKWIYNAITANSTLNSKRGVVSDNARSSYWQTINRLRVLEYIETSTVSTYNPTVFSYRYPVSYICWQTAVCDEVRATYEAATGKTGKDAWIAYIDDNFVCDLDAAGTATADTVDPLTGFSQRSGYRNTYALANETYKDADGMRQYLYPAMRYAADCAYNADGLRAGDWFVPSLYEGFKVDAKLTYGLSGVTRATADRGNQALNAIGGTAVSCAAYHWYSSKYNSYYAWTYLDSGSSNYDLYYGSFVVRRLTLYTPR